MGKVLGRIVQDRLKLITLPDSQCGLQLEGDVLIWYIIFIARVLVEKAREHHSDLFVLYVDLRLDLLCGVC